MANAQTQNRMTLLEAMKGSKSKYGAREIFTHALHRERLNIMPTNITRDYLTEHGKIVVNRINHEEYILGDTRYFCGWQSPCKRTNTTGGWIVYEQTPVSAETGEEKATA